MIPYTDTEKLIFLEELLRGDKVVIPTSVEHAEFMIRVSQSYINYHKDQMLEILRS